MNTLARIDPPQESASVVIVADVSGSMQGRRIQRLRAELKRLWPELNARLMAFSFSCRWCDGPDDLPEPNGNTDLAAALEMAATVWPAEVVVISDGMPDSPDAAIEAAGLIPGTISVLFVGDDGDVLGATFMKQLAKVGGGKMVHRDIGKNLAIGGDLRGLLALDPPIAL